MSSSSLLLITGASGPLGTSTLNHLLDTLHVVPERIVAGTRSPEKLAAYASRGVVVRPLDLNEPESVLAASKGVSRALLISTAGEQRLTRIEQNKLAIEAFQKAGVQHVLYTSLPAVTTPNPAHFVQEHEDTEKILAESSFPKGYTVLRNGIYFEVHQGELANANQSGEWNAASGEGKVAYISRDDLGLANAVALSSDSTGANILTLTGREAISIEDVVHKYNRVLGKMFTVNHVSEDTRTAQIQARTGSSESFARMFAVFEVNMKDGYASEVTNDYKKLTGRDAQTLDEWLEAKKTALLSP